MGFMSQKVENTWPKKCHNPPLSQGAAPVSEFPVSEQADEPRRRKGVKTGFWKSDALFRLYALQNLEVDRERGWAKALFQPRYRGGGAALSCAPMDAAESQQVQHNRQQHNEETGQE